jgi:hypothetical protein
MANLRDVVVFGNIRVYGSVTANAGYGFTSLQFVTTPASTALSWTWPTERQIVGRKVRITMVGGGGGGGGVTCANPSTSCFGSGGSSGGGAVVYLPYVSGLNSIAYQIGAGGTGGSFGPGVLGGTGGSTFITYNSITYTAIGGNGGMASTGSTYPIPGGAPPGTTNVSDPPNVSLSGGRGGKGWTNSGSQGQCPFGGNAPFGFGQGGVASASTTTIIAGGSAVTAGGYGGGGGGAFCGSSTTGTAVGGVGAPGCILFEY